MPRVHKASPCLSLAAARISGSLREREHFRSIAILLDEKKLAIKASSEVKKKKKTVVGFTSRADRLSSLSRIHVNHSVLISHQCDKGNKLLNRITDCITDVSNVKLNYNEGRARARA